MPKLFDHPYAEFLDRVAKPARYTGREHGVRLKDWHSVQCRVCLAFPDIYDIGMSHLGYRMLYKILNDNERIVAERCYTPWTDMVTELKDAGEWLRSLENARPLCDFDVVGFSLQYELTFTNILLMLDLGGIPLRAEHRGDDDPLIIAGGPVATHAEPMALFLDAIAIGDGEELAKEAALLWSELKSEGLPRKERLERLATLKGLYIPSLYETMIDPTSGLEVVSHSTSEQAPFPVERRLLEDISKFPFPDDGPVGGPEAIFDRMSIEVARGCTEGCRFCQAGMIYRPVRERDPEEVLKTVENALEKSGQDEVSLAALSTADVSCISPLIKKLVEKTAPERVSLSVASLRAYGLADDLLDDMRKVRAAGLTFAPEAGTQRMRDVINKNVTEQQLLETAERTFSRGFDKMKLYFMLGLPTEEDEDVLGIASVGKNALGMARKVGNNRAKVTVSVSTHVPKPHTPFQWCALDPLAEIQRKQALLRDAVGRNRNLQLRTHDSVTTVLEGILARGDRRLGPVIERAYLSGAYFDSWEEHLKLEHWQEALEHFEIDQQKYLGTIPITGRLPWDHFDIGLEEGFLLKEYRKALKNRLSPPCGKAKGMFIHHTNAVEATADDRKLICYDCGIACDMSQMRSQRVDYLKALGSEEPGQRARLPIFDPSHYPEGKAPTGPERYRPPRAGGTPERWRLAFTKKGPAALLGHLDLLRELPRIIRRAGVKTHYTMGYRPKPDVSCGPALPLGVISLDEYVDIKLIGAPESEELKRRLNASSSEGLMFTSVRKLEEGAPNLGKCINGAQYAFVFAKSSINALQTPTQAVAQGIKQLSGEEELARRIDVFLQKDKHMHMRRIKGIGKPIDVRSFVERAYIAGADAEGTKHAAKDIFEEARLVGSLVAVVVEVAVSQGGAARPRELTEALTDDAELPFRTVKLQTQGPATEFHHFSTVNQVFH